jgi:hypothetical protein
MFAEIFQPAPLSHLDPWTAVAHVHTRNINRRSPDVTNRNEENLNMQVNAQNGHKIQGFESP